MNEQRKLQRIRAGYLPGLNDDEVQWQTLDFKSRDGQVLEVCVPVLTAPQMQALACRVRTAAAIHLRPMPVAEIIDAVDRAMARLLDRNDIYRQQAEAWLPVVSGYDADMVRLGLTGFFKTFRAAQLKRFVAEDFANPAVLDGFQPAAKGGAVRAFGPDLLVHSWAGNVPALSLWSLVCGLLVKAPAIGKLASAEPLFAGWFAPAGRGSPAAGRLPGRGVVARCRRGGGRRALCPGRYGAGLWRQSDAGCTAPSSARDDALLPHGHKLGFGLIGAQALDTLKAPAMARQAAWDVMRYDQQGCYSPHVFYVQRGAPVSPRAFADYLAAELANLQRRFARRELDLEEGAALARWQQNMEWGGEAHQLLGPVDAPWSVAYSESLQPLAPTALYRTIAVVAVDRLDAVLPVVATQRDYLQTAGIAAGPEELYRLAGLLGAAGVTRISAIGSMSMPEAGWHHDGRFNLLDLVRMTEIEQSANWRPSRWPLMRTEGVDTAVAFMEFKQARFSYPGRAPVVDGVDWQVGAGEFHCLLGRSGCGKTTLLKLAAGLLGPPVGPYLAARQQLAAPGPQLGFMFQAPTLLDWHTVIDNVLLPVSLQRKPTQRINRRPCSCWSNWVLPPIHGFTQASSRADNKVAWLWREP
jgi:hypothetical protein